jgi:hypothetical protein
MKPIGINGGMDSMLEEEVNDGDVELGNKGASTDCPGAIECQSKVRVSSKPSCNEM